MIEEAKEWYEKAKECEKDWKDNEAQRYLLFSIAASLIASHYASSDK